MDKSTVTAFIGLLCARTNGVVVGTTGLSAAFWIRTLSSRASPSARGGPRQQRVSALYRGVRHQAQHLDGEYISGVCIQCTHRRGRILYEIIVLQEENDELAFLKKNFSFRKKKNFFFLFSNKFFFF